MLYFTYIVKCKDNSYYVGVTNNIERRIWNHNNGAVSGYTHSRRPVKLIYFQEFKDINYAISFEKQLKGWSRVKKEALISGDIESLRIYSKSYRNKYPSSSSG